MIPILYDSNETAFASNGLGRLRDAISVVVTEERNSVYECNFEYPITGSNYDRIKLGRIIAVEHDDTGDVQPFDIISCSRPINGVVTFHCVHISYRQRFITVSGTNINSLSGAFTALGTTSPTNPFSYQTDKTSTGYVAAFDGVPRSVRSVLGGVEGSILDAYGGEYEWDKWNVKLWANRGQARNFTIRYGVNMLEYNEDIDYSSAYTSVIPFWKSSDGNVVKGNKVASGSTPYNGIESVVPLDLSDKFETEPTTAQLESMAASYMSSNQTYLPAQTIEVDFIRLQDSAEYQYLAPLLKCSLCDTINVEMPLYNTSGSFKIVKTEWDVLAERVLSMELGKLSMTLSEALGITGKTDNTVASEWTLIKSVTGNVSTTIDLSDYGEVLVTCKITQLSTPRHASSSILVSTLTNNYQEWSVGYSSSAYTSTVGALFRLSLTNFTPQWAYANGTDYSSTAVWNVYGLKVKNLVNGGGGGGVTDYDALTSRPQINGVTLTGNRSSSDIGVADAVHTHTKSQITDFPTLASVATSGDYGDLSNKPTIPTVNDATLTIQKNGSTVKTFTANASSNVTANITVPTKVSDLNNDSGFISSYTETDPVFGASAAAGITSTDISNWNDKQDALTTGDGIDITSNVISNTQGIEYIVGTQAASTSAWTGVSKDTSLKTGKIIAYKLPYAGKSTAATLNLTMADGTTTGAKALRRTGSSTVTTHFAVNNVIILVYDGTYWRVSAYYDSNSNTIPTGYCTTAAATAAKSATCTYGYRDDATYFPCVFRYANTAANATLAIATYAETALPIYVNGARTTSSNTFGRGVVMFLYYNNAYYCYNDGRFPIVVNDEVTSIQDVLTSKSAASGGTALSLVTTGEKYTWDNKSNFSGDYTDLTNKPTIPTVNDATLTIQKNGTNVQTFTANSSTNKTANITVPTKVSELSNDSGFISSYTETDPVFGASAASGITSTDITNWNNKSNFSGSYNDLSDKPTIPTVNNATLTIQKNGTTVETFTANASSNATANITVPTATSELTNDSGFITSVPVSDVQINGSSVVSSGVATIPKAGSSSFGAVQLTSYSGGRLDITGGTTTFPVARLDSSSKIPSTILPDATTSTKGAMSAADKTKLDGITTDANKTTWTQITNSGTKIATIDIDGSSTDVYAPTSGSAGVTSWNGSTGAVTYTPPIKSIVSDGSLDGETYTLTDSSDVTYEVPSKNLVNVVGSQIIASIPTKTSDLSNDSGFLTSYTETDPVFSASAASGITSADITNWNNKSTFSGSYNDLSDKPSIPTVTDTYSGTSSNGMSGKAVKSAIDALDGSVTGTAGAGKTLTAFSQTNGVVSATFDDISITKSQVSDFPTLATVATSGDYDDLNNTPTVEKTSFTPSGCSNYANYGGCYYEKCGSIVHVHVGVSGLTANVAKTIYTLPSGCIPASPIFGHGTGGAANNIGYVEIKTNGQIYVQSVGNYCGADVTFMV